MFDIAAETAIALADVPKLEWIPKRRGGKKLSLATVYRWVAKGIRGVKLEVLNVGATKCTSHQALQRFFERLTPPGDSPCGHAATPPAPRPRSPAQRQKDHMRAEKRLAKSGC